MVNGNMGSEISTMIKRLGAWLIRANNTIYQAATDGFVIGIGATDTEPRGLTDGSNPPTIIRGYGYATAGYLCSFTIPVKKNDYWKAINCTIVYWIPLEP